LKESRLKKMAGIPAQSLDDNKKCQKDSFIELYNAYQQALKARDAK
jgi:hypothetical protein